MAAEVTPPEIASWYLSTDVSPLEGNSSECTIGVNRKRLNTKLNWELEDMYLKREED